MKQLMESKIDNGEYDSIIEMMLKQKFDTKTILHEIMILTKGHENPKKVQDRINQLSIISR